MTQEEYKTAQNIERVLNECRTDLSFWKEVKEPPIYYLRHIPNVFWEEFRNRIIKEYEAMIENLTHKFNSL